MAAKYYVSIRPQINGQHALHKEDCPFLPEDEKRIYLGIFASSQDAIMEGQRHFSGTNVCRFCLKEHQPERRETVFSDTTITGFLPSLSQIFQFQKGAALYYLN
jgi:hypothetical protein